MHQATYVSESCSERAPHQPVYNWIDARVETAEDGHPTQYGGRSWDYTDILKKQIDILKKQTGSKWHPAQRKDGRDGQAGDYEPN